MKRKLTVRIICTILSICMIALPCSAASYTYYTNTNDPNYDTTNLDKLYSSGDTTSWKYYLDNLGCNVTSYAMILANLGLKTSTKIADVRYSLTETKYRDADPFTVAYANCGFPNITYNSTADRYYTSTTTNPIYTDLATIAKNFNAVGNKYDLSSMTNAEKASIITEYVKKNPQGICITFSNPNASEYTGHMVVVTASTYVSSSTTSFSVDSIQGKTVLPGECIDIPCAINLSDIQTTSSRAISTDMKTFGKYFTVCDPVDTPSTPGENVLLSQTWTATEFSFSHITSIRTFLPVA